MIDKNGRIEPCYFCSKWGFCPDCQAELDARMEALRGTKNVLPTNTAVEAVNYSEKNT